MKSSTYLEPYKHHEYVPVQVGFIIIMIWTIRYGPYDMDHKNSQYHINYTLL